MLFVAACGLAGLAASLQASVASADEWEHHDRTFDRNEGPAGVNAISSCNGEYIATSGRTTDSYDPDQGRRGTTFKLSSEYRGKGVGSLGNSYSLSIKGDAKFSAPTGFDGTYTFFDFPYDGRANGPDHLSFAIDGTWRVYTLNGDIIGDTLLSLNTRCTSHRGNDDF